MEENIKEEKECFICLEISTKYENQPLRLSQKINYFKKCDCDGWVHDDCIEKWYYLNERCPICRNKVCFINFEYQYMINIIDIYLTIITFIKRVHRRLIFFLKIYMYYILTKYMFDIISITINTFDSNRNSLEYMYQQENNYYYIEDIYYNYTCPQIL